MDRLNRSLAGCGLALLAAACGCRSTRDEVPPGRGYRADGRQQAPVGFGSAPHGPQLSASGMPLSGSSGNVGPGGSPIVKPPGGDYSGTVPGAKFGAPGTAGFGPPPALSPTADPATSPASAPSTPAYPPQPADRGVMGEKDQAPPPY